jgi:hypothetical protein
VIVRRSLALLALAFAVCPLAFAQVTAALRGRAFDATGAPVAHAQVELIENATNVRQQAVTTESGDYLFTNLNPGTYSVHVTAQGFNPLERNAVTVILGQTVSLDLTLPVGGVRETVTVSSDAPLLQSEASNIQTNIPGQAVLAMPLNSRNFIQLSTLAPGVELPPGTLLPRINGGRPRTNEYLYDGISALQRSPDKSPSSPSSTTSKSSPSRPTTCPPSLAASTAVSSTWRRARARTRSTAACSSSCATKT